MNSLWEKQEAPFEALFEAYENQNAEAFNEAVKGYQVALADNLPEDRDGIEADLRAAGFDSLEIDKAFDWLDGLAQGDACLQRIAG